MAAIAITTALRTLVICIVVGFFFGPSALRFAVPIAILVSLLSSDGRGKSRQDEEYEQYCKDNPEPYWKSHV